MLEIFRPVLRVLFGTGSAQAIALLLMPVISRLYTPADYGVFGIVLSVSGLVIIFSTLQLHQAAVLPESLGTAIRLCRLSCEGAAIGGLSVFAATFLFSVLLDSTSWMPSALPVLAGLAVTVAGISQSIQSLAVRRKKFSSIANAAILRVLVVGGFQITLGTIGAGSSGLLLGYVAGEVAVIGVLAFSSKAFAIALKNCRLKFQRQRLISSYADFAKYGSAQEFLNSASQGLPTLILGAFFGPNVAGYYAFAMRVLMAPAQLVGNAVRQVLSQRFAVIRNKQGPLDREFRFATFVLLCLGLVGALITSPFMVELFSLIFGTQWSRAGSYGGWLVFWVAFLIGNIPTSVIFKVIRKQKQSFYLNVVIFISRFGILFLGGMFLTDVTVVAILACASVVWNLIYIRLGWRYLLRSAHPNIEHS